MATQVNHPWRATARTVFAGVVAVATLIPLVALQVFPDGGPAWVAWIVGVAGLVTRVLATPAVNKVLASVAPWLLPAPKSGEVVPVPADGPAEAEADDGEVVWADEQDDPNAV
jgi:hypothetical protein